MLVLLYPPERDAVNPATVKSFPLFAPHFVRSCLDFSLLEEILHIFSRENHARFKSSSPSPLILGLSRKKLLTDTGETVVTPVTTGFSDGRNVQILSGLEEGDIVLIESRVNS